MNPPTPRILRTGDYSGHWISCVPTLALDALLDTGLDDEELTAVADELRFRMFLRRKGLAEEPIG